MSEEAINKRNEMFREVHPAGPATHEKTFVTVDESVYNGAFTATQGKTLADVQRENEQTVDDLFKQEEIGSVFEKGPTLEEKSLAKNRERMGINDSNSGIGIDANEIKTLKQELDSQSTKIKEPSIESSFGLLK